MFVGTWLGKKVALKNLKPEKTDAQAFIREVQVSLRLHHPSVVACYGVSQIDNELHVVLEYCANGSLLDYLKTNGKFNSTKLTFYFFF